MRKVVEDAREVSAQSEDGQDTNTRVVLQMRSKLIVENDDANDDGCAASSVRTFDRW